MLELIKWLLEVDNKIAIFDATNSNINRRKEIINTIETFKIDNLYGGYNYNNVNNVNNV